MYESIISNNNIRILPMPTQKELEEKRHEHRSH